MKVLIIGGGGREHALAWKAAQSPLAEKVFVAPGNGGTAREPGLENVPIAADDIFGLLGFARRESIELTIVGPEVPLVAGVVDAFQDAGLPCFGPTQAAAQLEGSKSFAKDFLARHEIPTAAYGVFTDIEPALEYLRQVGAPIVVKADGLAAGKGVILANDLAIAEKAVRDMLGAGRFGQAGARVVIEEFLTGEEASFIAMVDGHTILPLASSQDHKARDDGDLGPNTGGMGAYSPAPVVTPEIHDRIMREVMEPTVRGLASEGLPYVGFLYAGLMIAPDGTPKVLEFNCRMGDPETQPLLIRLKSDLVTLCHAALEGQLDTLSAEWDPRPALGVVMAAGGYPDAYESGKPISGLDEVPASEAKVFHAGTKLQGKEVVTSGGRVLCVTALGNDISTAHTLAYQAVDRIHWDQCYSRRDIGHRAIARES
ncbi:phosphoribosylamine--glycine ligase [Thiorhodococcus mannitoliphagus]|uniref:Phosphoribosylamine--glycine ligase n=1 Tax=Thiorhodococcus mannitoliphagus TaxID=329406 RepID=A0A6P1DXE3_9GAMM|nr:phosphoribosylamine--glycine ligase [Thiorhodococcus mannitoliphagus]NEX20384.1 phosphoribosylamine--glycine ligase [Thiorhodococcus mannitoliphagus]